ncbi:hypothetical protein R1sor_017562 [Riccia sorocarpa]|uniref:Uncharacterized protein n=1 Tax=Riccia sorocarpa TaxID=122646 RepID=A0ABD3I767_9MARC
MLICWILKCLCVQSLRAWRVKVSITQADQVPATVPPSIAAEKISFDPPPDPLYEEDTPRVPPPDRKNPSTPQRLKERLMDPASASPNPKVSKPSLGVRVLRTLFDNSPPTYTSAKNQAAAAAAAKEQELLRAQQLQKSQRQLESQSQQRAQQTSKNVTSRPPVPRNNSGEIASRDHSSRQSKNNSGEILSSSRDPSRQFISPPAVTSNLPERGGRVSPAEQRRGGPGSRRAPQFPPALLMSDNLRSVSFDSFDDVQSTVSTDSEYDSSSFYRHGNIQERELHHNMNRFSARTSDTEADSDIGSSYVDDPPMLESDKDQNSAERLEALKHEIERLRLENLVLRHRGTSNRHYDSDAASRESSVTDMSNAEDGPAEEWVPYAEYAPPGVASASVARFVGQQPTGHHRGEMRYPPGERFFPGEHAARAGRVGRAHPGHGSSSEAVSIVTDGSRASSRHNSGLLVDDDPHSAVTSTRHDSGMPSDLEDDSSLMSWDGTGTYGSRQNSGPLVLDRQELYESVNNSIHHSRNNSGPNSRNNSGMLVDYYDDLKGGSVTTSRSGGNSRVNSRHNSGMQVDREGRNLPPGLLSPRISFEGNPINVGVVNVPGVPLPNSTIKTVEETVTTHRTVTRERHLVEPESWNSVNNASKFDDGESLPKATLWEDRDVAGHHVEPPVRSSTPPPAATRLRNLEGDGVPGKTTTPSPGFQFGNYPDTEATLLGSAQHFQATSLPQEASRGPTPPRSRNPSHELDSTNSSMFSYPIPAIITLPRSRSKQSQLDSGDLSQYLQQQHSISVDNSPMNSLPRTRSTTSQMSTEDSGTPSSSAASQHQSTLERLMISQQRRQNLSSNSVNASSDHQYSRNPRQVQTKSPQRR